MAMVDPCFNMTLIMLMRKVVPLGRICFPIIHDRDKFSNREQSEPNRNDGNALCDYLYEYIRMGFQLYSYNCIIEDS